ncbi:hypothetical protein BDF14DRAFT_1884813 [Spinellus fusiger]|nr:hypothetical protein BDF14DRAFT_1884813 [Spinellus fusiger]
MGCCGSKEEHEQNEERTPLVGHALTQHDSQTNGLPYDTFDMKMEQDFWNEVVKRTTSNLIDLSSAQADPLQGQGIQERADRYLSLVEQATPTKDSKESLVLCTVPSHAIHHLVEAEPYSGMSWEDQEELSLTMECVETSLHQLQVVPVGEMVVPLTLKEETRRRETGGKETRGRA